MTRDGETLWSRIRHALEEHSDRPAITFLGAGKAPASYDGAALLARVEAVARAILPPLIERDGPLGILGQSQEMQVVHFLAALSLGKYPAVLTPYNRKLHRAYYDAGLKAVLEQCDFAAVVTEMSDLDVGTTLIEPFNGRRMHAATATATATAGGAFLQFSSGTTGTKRGVLVDDRAALAQLDDYAGATGLTHTDVIVSWLPLYHDMGLVACFLMPLARGVHTVMLHPLEWVARPSSYLTAVSSYRGTLSWHPNFAYSFMAERVPDADLSDVALGSLRGLVNCSEPVTHTSEERFRRRFGAYGLREDVFWGCYAMAETTFALTHGASGDVDRLCTDGPTEGALVHGEPAVSTGRPLPGVAIEVVGEDGRTKPDRELGEIRVRSRYDFLGYFNNAEATASAVRDGWYYTGDLGYRVGDELFVTCRKKDLLIVGGVNVWPQDIEDLACAVPGVHSGRAVAFSEFDPANQTEKVVILAESEAEGRERTKVVASIRQRVLAVLQLANFDVHVVTPGWLVKSSSGKISRSVSRDQWRAERRPSIKP